MDFKGMDQLRAHVPDLRSPVRSAVIGLIVLAVLALETAFFLAADRAWPDWTLDGQALITTLAFLITAQFFLKRREYRQRYGGLAYRNAFGRFVLTGLPMMLAGIAHIAYMPGPPIPLNWWTLGLIVLGWYFIIVGFALWARAVWTFGADNLAMLYVYFPEEGQIVRSSIYSVLRHPLYASIVRLAFGLALLNGNWFAVTFALIVPLGLTVWLAFIEERELLERFGQGYADYRRKTPAFWPRPKDYGKFLRFLVSGR